MTAGIDAPRGFNDWLGQLRQHGIGGDFDEKAAAWLRVVTATKSPALILATGAEAIPYADWAWDGMSMNSRLILHNQSSDIGEMVRPHFATDIRVATHQQDLTSFLSDIEKHRFDFVIVDLDDADPGPVSTLLERLTEQGLFMCFGTPPVLDEMTEAHRNSHFSTAISARGKCVALSRKGLQHRAVRRGGRRRHSPTKGR